LKIGQSAGNSRIGTPSFRQHLAGKILAFPFLKALRDYTPHAQTLKKTGDEIVQTTTPEILAAGESQSGM
jgi:hypothetical protein